MEHSKIFSIYFTKTTYCYLGHKKELLELHLTLKFDVGLFK